MDALFRPARLRSFSSSGSYRRFVAKAVCPWVLSAPRGTLSSVCVILHGLRPLALSSSLSPPPHPGLAHSFRVCCCSKAVGERAKPGMGELNHESTIYAPHAPIRQQLGQHKANSPKQTHQSKLTKTCSGDVTIKHTKGPGPDIRRGPARALRLEPHSRHAISCDACERCQGHPHQRSATWPSGSRSTVHPNRSLPGSTSQAAKASGSR